MKHITVFLIVASAIAVTVFSRLWRYPMENAFLIIFVSVPFILFFLPAALAKRKFALLTTVGFLVAATCFGIFQYYGEGQAGPEIPTVYLIVPIVQSILAFLSVVIASIDFFMAERQNKRIA
jgi:hypothetical protein